MGAPFLLISPQQAAAMRPAAARRKCVELSARLDSMARSMAMLEEEAASWRDMARRAASDARVSGLPRFKDALRPPCTQADARAWILAFVRQGLSALCNEGTYRHMLFVSVNDNPT